MLPAMRFLLGFWWVLPLFLGFGFPATSFAYCRTTTAESLATSCPEVCQITGLPLYWPKRDLTYVLNERGFPDLSPTQLQSILATAFGAWEKVQCEGGASIDLSIEQLPGRTQLEVGPRVNEPNDNVIVHIPEIDWDDDPRAFAITKIWYNKKNGHILGADMQFNGTMDPFGECLDKDGCAGSALTDLRNVVTHEAGHFLGLAHSDEPDSTMWCDAAPGDVDKRDLDVDDVAGLCAIYGPNAQPDPDAPSPDESNRRTSSCSAGPGGAARGPAGGGLVLVLAAFGQLLARLRRRVQ
jgi:hypothetical protein